MTTLRDDSLQETSTKESAMSSSLSRISPCYFIKQQCSPAMFFYFRQNQSRHKNQNRTFCWKPEIPSSTTKKLHLYSPIKPQCSIGFKKSVSSPRFCGCSQTKATFNSIGLLHSNHNTFTRNSCSAVLKRFYNDESKKPPSLHHHDTVLVNLQRLEDSLRYHGYSTVRIGFAVLVILGISVYTFRESIRENVADEVSQVASRSLDDRLVADKAEEFAKGLLNALLNDEPMHELASQFVTMVLQRSETRRAMNALVMGVLQDPKTKAQLTATIKQVIITALNEEDTKIIMKSMLKIILSDRETIDAVKSLLGNVFGEDEVKNLTASFFKDVLKSEVVVSQATTLGKDVARGVISDPVLQEKTGDSLWTAMKYSVTPRWFSTSPPSSSTSSSGSEEDDDDVRQDEEDGEEVEALMSELHADEESVLGG
ncbi:uncharacterized protein LOC117298429 isoform X1 [Asterias rubens]|uniref:uncharacterized protein LOC117298429 isoform X1 n=2 Tax=Asterias rubens TaxID=7604 RepID=UPI00145516E3|nr:uncharacterized protein LOC117298429 isoform X1 [Asterias rubens]XP_033637590.1 uncharacterized protein LOC117298429 isoform X1 [Asterias rubens]